MEIKELENIWSEKKAIIFAVLTFFVIVVAFVSGFTAGAYQTCDANNGTLLGFSKCVLDKCLEDEHVCKIDNSYYIVPNQNQNGTWW